MDAFDFLAISLLSVVAVYLGAITIWHLPGAKCVEGTVTGFRCRIVKWLPIAAFHYRPITSVVSFTTDDGTKAVVEISQDRLFKPEGHRVRLWVKKRDQGYAFYLPGNILYALAALCFWLSMVAAGLYSKYPEIGGAPFWLFVSTLVWLFAGFGMNCFLLKSVPFSDVFAREGLKQKMTKEEFEALEAQEDVLLTYEQVNRRTDFLFSSLGAKATALLGLFAVAGFILYEII